MNNFNFGEVLTRAWKTIWKHKVLWIFGILASCARGSGRVNGSSGNRNYPSGAGGNVPFSAGQAERMMNQAGQYLEQHIWIIFAVVVSILLLSFISYSLGMIGRIGLIKGTAKAEKGAEKLLFGEIWSESLPYFWRVFGLNFLIGLAVFIVIVIPLILLGVAFFAGAGGSRVGMAIVGLFVCLIPLLCVLIPISWALSIIIEQAQAAIVLEDLGLLDGFKRGWQIVKTNALATIVMWLILALGGGILSIILAMPVIIAFVPLLMGIGTLRQSFVPLYISLACCAVYMPVLIFFNGILTAYIQSAWALTFMQLAQPKQEAPVIIEANA
jgi:hypothetical protein